MGATKGETGCACMWQPRALAVAQCLTTGLALQLSLPDLLVP